MSLHQYNQAAVLDEPLSGFPEVVQAVAKPLAKVDKVTTCPPATAKAEWMPVRSRKTRGVSSEDKVAGCLASNDVWCETVGRVELGHGPTTIQYVQLPFCI